VLELKTWLEEQRARGRQVPDRRGLNHREGLTRFLDDCRIELDTNIVERGIIVRGQLFDMLDLETDHYHLARP
jgi:Transposase IS66 family